MRKYIILLLVTVLSVSMIFLGVCCKESAAEETVEADGETVEAVSENQEGKLE